MITLSDDTRTARKEHHCSSCARIIRKGERYRASCNITDDGPYTWKECAHCQPLCQFLLHALNWCDDDGYYPLEQIPEWEPRTIAHARLRVMFMRRWTRHDGTLYPVPALTTEEAVSKYGYSYTRYVDITPGGDQ